MYTTERSQYKNDYMLQSHLYDSGKDKTTERVEKKKPTNKKQRSTIVKDFKGVMDKWTENRDVGGITVFHALL